MRLLLLVPILFMCGLSATMVGPLHKHKIGQFAPTNDKKIPEHGPLGRAVAWSGLSHSYGITSAEFNAVLDRELAVYGPKLAAKGYQLVFNRLWSNPTVNSDTDVEGNQFVINSYGGLARASGMSANGYAVVACHELGHHLGGAPLFAGQQWPGGGPSVEGESDYFATKECMKVLGYSRDDIKLGAQSCAGVLASLGGDRQPSPNTPDQSVVGQTNPDHPMAQCRLDTYLAGNNCAAVGPFSNSDPHVNSCYYYPAASIVARSVDRLGSISVVIPG
jgi:hypothetical protein